LKGLASIRNCVGELLKRSAFGHVNHASPLVTAYHHRDRISPGAVGSLRCKKGRGAPDGP